MNNQLINAGNGNLKMDADSISKNGKTRKSRRNSMIVIIASLFMMASVLGHDGILPYLYLENKNGDILEIPFTDGNITIMENQILIDALNNHYEYDYDDVERFYFKDKSHLTLSGLTASEGELAPEFSEVIFSYTLNVPSNTTAVTLTATASDPNATVTGDGRKALPNQTNTFAITVTADDGETTLVYTVTVNHIKVTGIMSDEFFDFAIYPNPTDGKFTVHIPENPDGWLISIYNMQGQKTDTKFISDEYTDIDINQYPAGVYLLEITSKSGQKITEKLVKE